jgi:quinoprotein glucose dehydrogenase
MRVTHSTWPQAAPRLTAASLLFLGIALATIGAVLTTSNLAPYDMIVGTGLVATALLLMRGVPAALSVYAVVIVTGVAFSVWQHGLVLSSLVPRADMLAPIGIWLLMPWVTRDFAARGRTPKVALATAVALAFAAIGAAAICAPNQLDENNTLAMTVSHGFTVG